MINRIIDQGTSNPRIKLEIYFNTTFEGHKESALLMIILIIILSLYIIDLGGKKKEKHLKKGLCWMIKYAKLWKENISEQIWNVFGSFTITYNLTFSQL